MLRKAGDGGRRVEDDLRAVEPELARALGEVAVVADVDADLGVARLEDRIAEVARLEVVLLQKPGATCGMWFFRYLPRYVPSASMTAAVL